MARGSIEQRSPGTWSIRVDLPPDPVTGKRRQKRATFRGTKREAEKRLSEMLHQLDTGGVVTPGKATLGDFLRQWLRDYVETGVRATTAEGYRIIVEKHLIPGLGNTKLADLKPFHLQSYYAKALKEGHRGGKGGLSARTVQHHHRVLSEALNHAVKWGLVGRNVALAVDPPRPNGAEMVALDSDDVARLLEAARPTPYYALIHLAIYTGMRRSELLGLRWCDVDLLMATLSVVQTLHVLPGGQVVFEQPKTNRSRRSISLTPASALALKAHREQQEALLAALGTPFNDTRLVFSNPDGSPWLGNSITHAFERIARKAGLGGITFHGLRHTHATLMLKSGTNPKIVSERLGHSTIALTMDVYSHVIPGLQEAAARAFDHVITSQPVTTAPEDL